MTETKKIEERVAIRAAALNEVYGHLDGRDLLRVMIEREFPGRIALASSFGAEAGVLLDLVAEVAPKTPVLFLDTQKLFDETLSYKDQLVERLGLANIRILRPDAAELIAEDPDETLWSRDYDGCCDLRKVRPLDRALVDYDAWITGRKRFHGDDRTALPTIEAEGKKIKINPLARWTPSDIDAAFKARDLPPHPLVAKGYLSIGCTTCTRQVNRDEAIRAGRWTDNEKTECGIHQARSHEDP